MGKKKELVVSVIFDEHDGERHKIPTTYHDIEKITLLDCGEIDCLCHGIQCENCIFHKGKIFRKGELELIVEEKEEEKEEYNLEDLKDLEEIKDLEEMGKYKNVKKFVMLKDKEDKIQLLPFIGNLIIIDEEIKIGCVNIDCYRHGDLNCRKCPFKNHGKLNLGEFKILKPKDKK